MKVKKSELVDALSKVKPGLAKKEIVEQATHFIFSQGEIITFNDQISIMHPFDCDFDFSVKGEEFFKIVSGITEEEIDLSLKDNTLHIKSKTINIRMANVLRRQQWNYVAGKIC